MFQHSKFLVVAALILAVVAACAGGPTTGGPAVNVSSGLTASGHQLGLHGYDAVAYFTDGAPTLGDASHSAVHDGVAYRFASEANREAFEADPDRYTPEFGGYCAYGVSVGKKFDGDPNVWAIEDGKLYLNLNRDIQALWVEDIPAHIAAGEREWATIRDVPVSSL